MRRVLFLFGELSDSDVEWLGGVSRLTKLAVGDVLIEAGRRPTQLALLLDGELAVVTAGAPPTEIARLHTGEVVGELTFLDPRPPLVSVVARTPCLVLQVAHASVEARLARDSDFGMRFYRGLGVFLASRLRETTGRIGLRGGDAGLAEQSLAADELDDESMDRTALAARRFEFLRAKLGVA